MKLPKHSTFYSRVPKRVLDKASAFILDHGKDSTYIKEKLGQYWSEFHDFWSQCGETPTWFDFVIRSHNLHWFIVYVFARHPEAYASESSI